MDDYINMNKLLNSILDYYILDERQENICKQITNEIERLGKDNVVKFLKWHKLFALLPPNPIINNSEFRKETLEKNRELINISSSIASDLTNAGIDFCFLKGISLMMTIYDSLGDRSFKDIDIFVKKKNLDLADHVISAKGFIHGDISEGRIIPATKSQIKFQRIYTHELYRFVKLSNNRFIFVDVNHLFSWKGVFDSTKLRSLEEINNPIVTVSKCNVCLPVLNAYYQLLHLCIHFYNESMYFTLEQNYDGSDPYELRLFRLYDIMLLIEKQQIDPKEFINYCNKFDAHNKVAYVFSILRYIFGNRKRIDCFGAYFKLCDLNQMNYYFTKDGRNIPWPICFQERLYNINCRSTQRGWLHY